MKALILKVGDKAEKIALYKKHEKECFKFDGLWWRIIWVHESDGKVRTHCASYNTWDIADLPDNPVFEKYK